MRPVPDTQNITAVIPAHNRIELLSQCVHSILPYVKEVIIIDNASDEDIHSLEKEYEKVHVFTFNRNLGPCAAQNIGVNLAVTPYVLLLDSDVELIKWSWTYINMDDCAAMQFYVGDKYFWMYSNHPDDYRTPQYLPWFYGCAVLIDREDWITSGGYNEKYFAYYQEPEICARLNRAGKKIKYNPDCVFIHYDSEIERDHAKSEYWKTRNLLWFSWENLPMKEVIFQNVKQVVSNTHHPIILWNAYRDALKDMPHRNPVRDPDFINVWTFSHWFNHFWIS